MMKRNQVAALLGIAACVTCIPSFVHAQTVPAACRPMVDAERKEATTAHHLYQTEKSALPGENARTSESISTGDATYIMIKGKWQRSPMGPKEWLAQLDENLKTMKWNGCQQVGEESVGGVTATVYRAQSEDDGAKEDVRVWVAKSSGLVLRVEEDVDTGGKAGKLHRSVRYEHDNVRAP
jgi:hypothetical protein